MSASIVSVIVPTKNSARTLEACLESIKHQTYKPIEIIVIDNFSSDTTAAIGREYATKFLEMGPERSAQRNYGVKVAMGEFVLIIDSDMELSPTVVAECVKAIEANHAVQGVVIPEESFGEGFWAQCKKLERSFYVGVPYMEAARFFRRKTFNKLGGYDIDMVSGEDWDFSQRVEAIGKIARARAYIYHNEGRISLLKTIKKKYYYAQKFAAYRAKNKTTAQQTNQTSIMRRYWLFLSKPLRLSRHPILSCGMLFMKTCEFGFGGLGYLAASKSGRQEP